MLSNVIQYIDELCNGFQITQDDLFSRMRMENVFADNLSLEAKISRQVFSVKVRKQMKELQELARSNNIRVAFFKGLIEACDLYEESYHRYYSDIDVLISPEDACEFLLLCKNIGYKFIDKDIIKEDIETQMAQNSVYHFSPIINSRIIDSVPIEIHFSFDTLWFLDPEPVEYILDNAVEYNISDYNYVIPCIEDRLIILLHHFGRHLIGEFGAIVYSPNKCIYHAKTLYDAILLYNKYINQLDTTRIVSSIDKYGFKYEILVAIKTIKLLFGVDFYALAEIADLPEPSNRNWSNLIYKTMLSQMTIERLIESESKSFYRSVIGECIKNNDLIYKCCKDNRVQNYILLDEYIESKTKARFGTMSRCGLVPASSDDCSAKAFLSWDDEGLNFDITVSAKLVQFYDQNELDAVGSTVALVLYNPHFSSWEHSTIGIHIVPVISRLGNIFLRFEYCGEWDDPKVKRGGTIPDFDINKYSIDMVTGGFRIKMKLMWQFLHINPKETHYLGMELVVNHSKPNDYSLNAILAWANIMPNYYNPAKFGKLILIE